MQERWTDAAGLYREYLSSGPDPRHAEEASYLLAAALKRGQLPGLEAAIQQHLSRFPDGTRATELRSWLGSR